MKNIIQKILLILLVILASTNLVNAEENINLYTEDDYLSDKASFTLTDDIKEKIKPLEKQILNLNIDNQIKVYGRIDKLLTEWFLYREKYSEKTKSILINLRATLGEQFLKNSQLRSKSISKYYNHSQQKLFKESEFDSKLDIAWEKDNRFEMLSKFKILNKIGDYLLSDIQFIEWDNVLIFEYNYKNSKGEKMNIEFYQYLHNYQSPTRNSTFFCSNSIEKNTLQPLRINQKVAYNYSQCGRTSFLFRTTQTHFNNTRNYIEIHYGKEAGSSKQIAKTFLYNTIESHETKREIKHNDFIVNTKLIDGTIYIDGISLNAEAVSYKIGDHKSGKSGPIKQGEKWEETFSGLSTFNIAFYDKDGGKVYDRYYHQSNDLSTISYKVKENKLYAFGKIKDNKINALYLQVVYMPGNEYININNNGEWEAEVKSPDDRIEFYSEDKGKKIHLGQRNIYPMISE